MTGNYEHYLFIFYFFFSIIHPYLHFTFHTAYKMMAVSLIKAPLDWQNRYKNNMPYHHSDSAMLGHLQGLMQTIQVSAYACNYITWDILKQGNF